MGLEIFDKLWVTASEEIKDVAAVLKAFKKNDWEKDLVDIKVQKKQFKVLHNELLRERDGVYSKKKSIEKNIITLTKKLKSTDKSIEDIDNLKQNKDILLSTLTNIDSELGELVSRSEKTKSLNNELRMKLENHTVEKTEQKFVELEKLESTQREIEIDIDKIKIEVRIKLDKIETLGDLEYDEECDYCMKNPFTLDAIETKKKLESDKDEVKQYLSKLDAVVFDINLLNHIRGRKIDLEDNINKLQKITTLKNELDSKSVLLEEKRKNVLHQTTSVDEKIVKYYEQEKDIIYNQQIEVETNKIQIDLDDINNQSDTINDNINNIFGEIKVVDTKRRSILDNIKKVEELESKYEAYQYYLDAVKRDGVPYELITKALPTIEGEVNNILSQLVDFQMLFEMDGKNINNYIVYDDDNVWPLELSSGMERFISSLAMRIGLINISNLPAANFLAIDEGWGTMDSDNLNSVYSLFQYLKTQFQFTMIVSHIDSMRDAVDTLHEIKKEDNFSNVSFD
jgi:hypothetical protein